MATSLISMLNRLPIYNRPKEPAIGVIGNPVLIETSNASLATLPTIPVQPKYDHFGNLILPPSTSNSNPNNWKKLPPLPGQSQPESPPVKYTPFRIPPPTQASDVSSRDASPPSFPERLDSRQPLISRKPTPAAEHQNEAREPNPERGPSRQSRNAVTDDVSRLSGKKNTTQGRAASPIVPATFTGNSRGLVKHQSIDDWIGRRQRTEQAPPPPLKIEGRTTPPRSSQRRVVSASAEPPKLAIRQSAFAPLNDSSLSRDSAALPETFGKGSTPSLLHTKIPKPVDTFSDTQRKYESAGKGLLHTLNEAPDVKTDAYKSPDPGPKDHIVELEESRERLISERIMVNKEIYDLEQSLAALSFTSLERELLKERIEHKKQELADIGKDIFDTGMLIHRAWKRKVKKENMEAPTHLWIHNVAGNE